MSDSLTKLKMPGRFGCSYPSEVVAISYHPQLYVFHNQGPTLYNTNHKYQPSIWIQFGGYCWWKKSCTIWYMANIPLFTGVLAPSQVFFSPDFWTIHHQVQRFNPRILSIPDVAPSMVAWDMGFFQGDTPLPLGPAKASKICFGGVGAWNYIYIDINKYIYIYIHAPKPGRSPTRQYSVLSCFFPSSAASVFFVFQEAFSSCGSSQSSASAWKADHSVAL